MTRRSKTIFFLFFMAVLGTIVSFGQSPRPLVRDLSKYDDGKVFEFHVDDEQQKRDAKIGIVRDFLWNHWIKKRRGFVQVRFWSAGGDPANYDLYIEPGKAGNWRLIADYERQCCIEQVRQKLAKGIHFNTGTLYYARLERRTGLPGVESTGQFVEQGDRTLYGKPIRDGAKRTGENFVLLFRKEARGTPDWML